MSGCHLQPIRQEDVIMSNREPFNTNPVFGSTDPVADPLNPDLDESLPPRTDAHLDPPFSANDQNATQSGDDMASKAKEKAGEVQQKAGQVGEQVQEKAREVTGQVQDKASQVGEQAHTMSDKGIDSAASGLDQAASMLRQQGEGREGALGTAASTTADTLESASAYLHEKDTDQMMSDLEALVRKRPVESVLVAAGVGFVLSKVFG
jgi:ElaB/YqjD/DUF883 family membrane-anchored ribosome-binding protein